MKLFVGLGNPGSEYQSTRHNIGFEVVEQLAKQLEIPLTQTKFNAIYGKGNVQGEDVFLLKPLTYMNASGEAVGPFMRYFKLELDDLIVIYDDLDLAVGKIRLRLKGSAGGHNGMKSIIRHVGSQDFKRIRVGIGRPEGRQPVVDFVLKPFSKEERPIVDETVKKAALACTKAITEPFTNVMNAFN
ncbi:aminoacyl-tRNA hydrolase [Tuberibacillus calidus]|jgi:PTH1 family peptidyl-tRNA hydrolase|uniref:aminoacyl-tRNA hydrolase n=1 Tax=Tuberibacillus calidus TaxID=340097 RepID=UPI0003F80987|nr:aminoacyl-tRNA hydrolase [Tuberibacillus calidus]